MNTLKHLGMATCVAAVVMMTAGISPAQVANPADAIKSQAQALKDGFGSATITNIPRVVQRIQPVPAAPSRLV